MMHLPARLHVSAAAKIPIVPVEFSPPLNVVNRRPLHTEEDARLVKGERRARTERTATALNLAALVVRVCNTYAKRRSAMCTSSIALSSPLNHPRPSLKSKARTPPG
jgi:hypothetical protein